MISVFFLWVCESSPVSLSISSNWKNRDLTRPIFHFPQISEAFQPIKKRKKWCQVNIVHWLMPNSKFKIHHPKNIPLEFFAKFRSNFSTRNVNLKHISKQLWLLKLKMTVKTKNKDFECKMKMSCQNDNYSNIWTSGKWVIRLLT